MLSTRGRRYAALDLAAGYTKDRGHLYDKNKYPDGLVSFQNAENVSRELIEYLQVLGASTDVWNSFSCKRRRLTTSGQRLTFKAVTVCRS